MKSGITIGDDAIIESRTVVTHDVFPYQIIAGNPAKPLKFRFDNEIINRSLILQWWDMPDDFLFSNIFLFQQPLNVDIVDALLTRKLQNE